MARKSRYTAELEKLGFQKLDRPIKSNVEITEAMIGRTLNRKERRAVEKVPIKPLFTLMTDESGDPMTEAGDETGQIWTAPGHIDLTHLGFRDNLKLIGNLVRSKLN